ncbi:MAG: YafY family transcriptional regulator [Clostridiales bacterium]|nr:YafY family transcriptional regulator [Clostridiales bacterium]
MRTERLFNIVAILLSKDTVSAKELANRFNVSTRTIYRDVDVLSVSGVPIYMKKGYGGGISLMDGYKLDKTMLRDEDIESIMMSIGALSATGYKGVDDVIDKFSSIFHQHDVTDWVEIDFTNWATNKNSDKSIEQIKTAILERHLVKITYFSSYGQKTQRTVAPLKLIFKSHAWYVNAYCLDKSDVRMFKILRMREIIVTDESFDREKYLATIPIKKENNFKIESITMKMKFKPKVLYLLYDWYNENDIKLQDDGSYIVTATFPMDEWVYSHILSYGDNVEVLEPLYMKEEIQKRLKNILRVYQKEN